MSFCFGGGPKIQANWFIREHVSKNEKQNIRQTFSEISFHFIA
jgi:hypothetical protein